MFPSAGGGLFCGAGSDVTVAEDCLSPVKDAAVKAAAEFVSGAGRAVSGRAGGVTVFCGGSGEAAGG